MRRIILSIMMGLIAIIAIAQERTVENRPYTDLRPFHFGVLVGTHLQDLEFINAGPVTYTDENGAEVNSNVTIDQDRWDPGFTVGVLGEFRLSTHFQFRIAPAMYFGTRHLTFHNIMQDANEDGNANRKIKTRTEDGIHLLCLRHHLLCSKIQQSSPLYHGRYQSDDEPQR